MSSVLASAPFTQFTLTYEVETGNWTTDEFGNPVAETTSGTLTALLAPFKATQLERLEGADANSFRARGELVSPLTFPSGVRIGAVLDVTYAGRAYKATLTNIIRNDLEGVAFGAYFEVDMRAA